MRLMTLLHPTGVGVRILTLFWLGRWLCVSALLGETGNAEKKDEGACVTGCERNTQLFTFYPSPHFFPVAKLHDNKVFVSSKWPSSFLSPAGAWPGVAGGELNGRRGSREGRGGAVIPWHPLGIGARPGAGAQR